MNFFCVDLVTPQGVATPGIVRDTLRLTGQSSTKRLAQPIVGSWHSWAKLGRTSQAPRQSLKAMCSTRPTAIITGANAGIGLETTKGLVTKGYNIIMVCRSAEKATSVKQSLVTEFGAQDSQLEVIQMDLADLESVQDVAKSILDSGKEVDVLINNAGIMAPPFSRTKQGFESQFGVNHLGHFAFTLDLLPLLTTPNRPTRIITLSSNAHYQAFSMDDLNVESTAYNSFTSYAKSKLANLLFAFHLARNLPAAANCTSNTLHPGVVSTELFKHVTPTLPPFLAGLYDQPLISLLPGVKTPPQGAETSIYLATSPEVATTSGLYFEDSKPVISNPLGWDIKLAERLWHLSLELTGREEVKWAELGQASIEAEGESTEAKAGAVAG